MALKLGKRLEVIHSLASTDVYDQIWDCCCDHGLLGMQLLADKAAAKIHFVDVVPDLIKQITHKLEQHFSSSNDACCSWETHCISASDIPIEQHNKQRHLVIIAGVGGDLTTELVEKIQAKHTGVQIDFLLCPVRHLYHLRSTLKTLKFHSKQEILVEDNERFYEVLLVAQLIATHNVPVNTALVSEFGDQMWQPESSLNTSEAKQTALRYLTQQITHYKKRTANAESDSTPLAQLKQIRRSYF